MKKKQPCAKRYADYSIQFYRDKKGVLRLFETANDGDIADNGLMDRYGRFVAYSTLLNMADKEAFASFCQAYLDQFNLERGYK